MTENSFKARLRASAPAPHDETPEYERFSRVFAIVSPVSFVLAAYATYFALGARLDNVAGWLAREIPLLAPRIAFLQEWDIQSVRAYAASVASGALLFPVFLLINAVGYWKTVVCNGACRPVNAMTLVLLGLVLTVFGALGAIFFLLIPWTWDARYPGTMRLFFWPTSPMLGGLWWSTMLFMIFSTLVAAVKFAFYRRLKNE